MEGGVGESKETRRVGGAASKYVKFLYDFIF